MLRLLAPVVVLCAAASALAHPGHLSTSAHAHVGSAVVDVGGITLVALLAAALMLRVRELRAR